LGESALKRCANLYRGRFASRPTVAAAERWRSNLLRQRAGRLARLIRRSGVRAFAHRADVSAEDPVQQMFRRAVADFGTLDILVNNAGLQRDAPFHTMRLQQWNTVIGGCKAPRSERARQDAPLTITMP
jgi:NAD(P)-dependent dehydrogenase (short-subunit alcohol dehydrogenase family)